MANLPRTAKSADEWTSCDLTAYNITISPQPPDTFFGSHPSTLPAALDPAFLTAPLPPPNDPNTSEATAYLLRLLSLVQRIPAPDPSRVPAIRDFTRELLALLGFGAAAPGALLCTRLAVPFAVCGDPARAAQPDVCLLLPAPRPSLDSDTRARTHTVLLVAQVRGTAGPAVGLGEPGAQVVAQAVAVFRNNNAARAQAGLGALGAMTVPAIVMLGTRPSFYRVPVTRALSEAVERGEYPAEGTEVAMCGVVPAPPSLEEGMEGVGFRRAALCHFEAFREMARGCWEGFVV